MTVANKYETKTLDETALSFFGHDEVEIAFNPELSQKRQQIEMAWALRDLETGVYHKHAFVALNGLR